MPVKWKPVGGGATRGRKLTEKIWTELVEAFREHPADPGAAGRAAKVDRRTAAKAWDVGLGYPFAKVPIKDIVGAQHQERRATRANGGTAPIEARARELAARDATGTMAEETRMVALARRRTLELLDLCGDLSKSAALLATRAQAQIVEDLEKVGDDKVRVDIADAAKVIRAIAMTSRAAASAAHECLEMERMLLGEPDGVETPEDDLSEEEAIAELQEGARVLERLRAKHEIAKPTPAPTVPPATP